MSLLFHVGVELFQLRLAPFPFSVGRGRLEQLTETGHARRWFHFMCIPIAFDQSLALYILSMCFWMEACFIQSLIDNGVTPMVLLFL